MCRFKNGLLDGKPYNGPIYNISSFIWVKQGDDDALMEVLDKYGPLAVSIDASHPTFVSYFAYVYGLKPSVCNSSTIGYLNLLKNILFIEIRYTETLKLSSN
jgi:hypothetical protein